MEIVVFADKNNKEEFLIKTTNAKIQITFLEDPKLLFNDNSADAIFILNDIFKKEELKKLMPKPVIINSTINTLRELELPENFIRINGWPGFLKRELWEVAAKNVNNVSQIFNELGWKYKMVKDTPGLISARIIAMIINEAYFALGEDVSSKNEIDLAMKLGTNYPYGPFEWCNKIGLKNIYALLKKLSVEDVRYNIAPAMEMEYHQIK